jgi:hypothetical protein
MEVMSFKKIQLFCLTLVINVGGRGKANALHK